MLGVKAVSFAKEWAEMTQEIEDSDEEDGPVSAFAPNWHGLPENNYLAGFPRDAEVRLLIEEEIFEVFERVYQHCVDLLHDAEVLLAEIKIAADDTSPLRRRPRKRQLLCLVNRHLP